MAEKSVLAAISGIQANQTYLDSIGNNIANADTVGYKDSEVQFADLLTEQLSGASQATATAGGVNPLSIGSGVSVAANDVDLSEGTTEETGNPSDVAISGNGYLVVSGGGQQSFTRDGSLTVDADGRLTTQEGGLIQGWQASSAGVVNTNAPLGDITIPKGETIGATATTTMTMGGNLPAWNGVGTQPSETTTINAYDALGDVVPVTLTFTGVAGTANEWDVAGAVTSPSGTVTQLFSTTTPPVMTFAAGTGELSSITGATTSTSGVITLPVTTMPAGYTFPTGDTLKLSFPAAGTSGQVTQFAASSTIDVNTQDGYPSGTLDSYSIGADGTITGSFSNGATLGLGQIALANFANPSGLEDTGGGLFTTSPNSGQAQIGTPGTGGRGTLLGGELEQSNVDLGSELTELITAQEAYTANTKVLTTSSDVIQALENVQ